jgi:3-oxoacyl-[acyl-carrier protein] reductase
MTIVAPNAPLAGRVALVTGVSRAKGIAFPVACRLSQMGATVFATGWSEHDAKMPWGADPVPDAPFEIHSHNLADSAVAVSLLDEVVAAHGAIDIVVAVHARSSNQDLLHVTAEELDRCWGANVRSIVLLARRFAELHDKARPGGRMIWFTSGQNLGPMANELPYAITKGAGHTMTLSLADALADYGIVANCINPGPVDTGWATAEFKQQLAASFPSGRWGTTVDIANVVSFLVSDEGEWIQGQVLNAEGGFRRGG